MDEWITIECPYCGQKFEIPVDASEPHQQFVTDCDVCCRPLDLHVDSRNGRVEAFHADVG